MSWTNTASGLWADASNWVPGAPSNSAVYITNALSKTVTIDAATPAGNLNNQNLYLWSPGSAINTLLLSGNVTPLLLGGSVAYIGNSAGAGTGLLALDHGNLVATNSSSSFQLFVGYAGTGTLTVSNGTFTAQQLTFGKQAGSQGTWNLLGGTNRLSGTWYAFLPGYDAGSTGIVNKSGGHLDLTGANVSHVGSEPGGAPASRHGRAKRTASDKQLAVSPTERERTT